MVIVVRCPDPKCRKYQFVEDADRGQVVPCLICKVSIRVPAEGAIPTASANPSKEKPVG